MQNFANQCSELAFSILSHNLNAIQEDGSILPIDSNENNIRSDQESGYVALALAECFRLTGKANFESYDLIDLAARCITNQIFVSKNIIKSHSESQEANAYTFLSLLSFGSVRERNPVWERLLDSTQKECEHLILNPLKTPNSFSQSASDQSHAIALSTARFSLGFSKKDDTSKFIDQLTEYISANSSTQFCPAKALENGIGCFDFNALNVFSFIRQAIQLHTNAQIRERKLPLLRTYIDRYLKLLPDIIRADGLGCSYGSSVGMYGQILPITIILQAACDGWISQDKKDLYTQLLQKLFYFFFVTFIDQEHGLLVIRDDLRATSTPISTRLANFEAVRYLCLWANLANKTRLNLEQTESVPERTSGRFISFNKAQKENGLFVYKNAKNGLHVQIPLIGSPDSQKPNSDYLAFPHSPGIIDWPIQLYMPILTPELTFGEHITTPSFYGKSCTVGIDFKQNYYFNFEQPDLINIKQEILPGIGSCQVNWHFSDEQISVEYVYTFENAIQMDSLRYAIVLSLPHSTYKNYTSLALGSNFLNPVVVKDDFQTEWSDPQILSQAKEFKTSFSKIHYLQMLQRKHPLLIKPKKSYRLALSFKPDMVFASEIE